MIEQSDDLTARMFAAAKTIDEFWLECEKRITEDGGPDARAGYVNAYMLRTWADRWDREATMQAAEDAAVEELAIVLWQGNPFRQRVFEWDEVTHDLREDYRAQAREVLAAGYRKGGAS